MYLIINVTILYLVIMIIYNIVPIILCGMKYCPKIISDLIQGGELSLQYKNSFLFFPN